MIGSDNEEDGDDGDGDHVNFRYAEDDIYDDMRADGEFFQTSLRNFFGRTKISRLDKRTLLELFRLAGVKDLPKDPRTLMKTPRSIDVHDVPNTEGTTYYFFGVETHLVRALDGMVRKLGDDESVKITLGIDGVMFFDSSQETAWPVLICLENDESRYRIFPACCTMGSKPACVDYVNETVDEIQRICDNGFLYNNTIRRLEVVAIICDAPARAYMKSVMNHNSGAACERCTALAVKTNNTMVFYKFEDFDLQTDATFRAKDFAAHHDDRLIDSPWLALSNFDMVREFPLDYMHMVCLGVMKRLVTFWTGDKYKTQKCVFHLGPRAMTDISARLSQLKKSIPNNFVRRPRSFACAPRYKATELRTLLLYTGPIVLRGSLPKVYYDHFLLLSVAINLMLNEKSARGQLDYARGLLTAFVRDAYILYGDTFVVFNVHNLLHLGDDVERFGCLEKVSAFRFENFLGQLKKKVWSNQKPLVQLAKRLEEFPVECGIKKGVEGIRLQRPNNCYLLRSGKIVDMIERTPEGRYMYKWYRIVRPAVELPVNTVITGFLECLQPARHMSPLTELVDTNDIVSKVWRHKIPDEDRLFFMVLNHCAAFEERT